MTGAVALLRVRSSRAPYRRGGIEFGNLPLFLGPEHFAEGIDGLRSLTAIVTDPVLTVHMADVDTPDLFLPVPEEARDALIDALHAFEVAEDKSTLNDAVAYIVAGLIGEREPDPAIELAAAEARRIADEAEAQRLADEAEGRRLADEAEARRVADEAEAQRLADEAEAQRLADAGNIEPEKGAAVPAEATPAKAVAKPRGSSGRQSKAATTPAAKG